MDELEDVKEEREPEETFPGHKGLPADEEECDHPETDHFVCLHCGAELDPGEAIDRAMDFLEDR